MTLARTSKILFFSTLLVTLLASANITERIDTCQKSENHSCVFDILKELAAKTSGAEVNRAGAVTATATQCGCLLTMRHEKGYDRCFVDLVKKKSQEAATNQLDIVSSERIAYYASDFANCRTIERTEVYAQAMRRCISLKTTDPRCAK